MAVITLLTDFGSSDTYVGQMKGAILAVAPGVSLVDLSHAVAPQDVHGGAYLLWSAVGAFEPGTVHLAVVDPGVGSTRRHIALRARGGHFFVGPDNGLLVPAAERLDGIAQSVELTNARYWRPSASSTFHGRDIFGPVAGHIARGVALSELGSPLAHVEPLWFPKARGLDGAVLHVDTYGNLVTNIPAASLPPRFRATVGSHTAPSATHYAAVERGALVAVVGSVGLLEISARDASAAAVTGATRGTPVSVERL